MTKLSVNINKVATLRNARGGNYPDVERFALDCERFGAQGITVHPRADERHIRKEDVYQLKSILHKELNVEGNPTEEFIEMVMDVCPAQVTLVPDSPTQLTSNHGWNVDASPDMVELAKATGADRVEIYTGPFVKQFEENPKKAIEKLRPAAEKAREMGLGLNMGHDLNLDNLGALVKAFPWIAEVSIGHAIITDALYLGIQETLRRYREAIDGAEG